MARVTWSSALRIFCCCALYGATMIMSPSFAARVLPCSSTSGTASICGHDVETDTLAAKRSIGYLPEGAPLYGEMTVLSFLEFIADLRARRWPAMFMTAFAFLFALAGCVVPSVWWESFALVISEAWACGRPVSLR